METLTSSSWRLFVDKYRDRDGAILCPKDAMSSPHICFLRPPTKYVEISFLLSVSLQQKTIHYPRFLVSSSSSDTQTHIQKEETQIKDTNQSKTVHVKFQLQRECSFGQHYFIVGDDPMFGLWDPTNAVLLNWSDGHVWTVELDIPIGKSIEFKFILKGGTEDILWQPGPDRVLKTWETKKTITVCEDWDNAELQKLIEEEPTSIQKEESAVNPEMLIVAENLTQSSVSQPTDVIVESTTTNSIANPKEIPFADKLTALVADNITDPREKAHSNTYNTAPIAHSGVSNEDNEDILTEGRVFGNNGRAVNVKDLASPKDEGDLSSYEEVPLLVPGLTPFPTIDADEAFLDGVEKQSFADASIDTDKAKDFNVPELDLKEAHDNHSLHPKETTEELVKRHGYQHVEKPLLTKEPEQQNTKQLDNPVLQNDIQWGRKTLQKLLANLGFQ